jgi:RPA family protein
VGKLMSAPRAWFPAGPEQDGVVLIKVRPEHVEYVHPSTGRLKVLYSLVKQVVARAPGELAQKKELDLH